VLSKAFLGRVSIELSGGGLAKALEKFIGFNCGGLISMLRPGEEDVDEADGLLLL
jgi:hypothetical protein